ncbi:MAG: SPOR domain-containing protein [Bacteroidota bacterium]
MSPDLIARFAEPLGLSAGEARPVLARLVESIHRLVQERGGVFVPGLGTFRQDGSGIAFEPAADLADSVNHRYVGLDPLVPRTSTPSDAALPALELDAPLRLNLPTEPPLRDLGDRPDQPPAEDVRLPDESVPDEPALPGAALPSEPFSLSLDSAPDDADAEPAASDDLFGEVWSLDDLPPLEPLDLDAPLDRSGTAPGPGALALSEATSSPEDADAPEAASTPLVNLDIEAASAEAMPAEAALADAVPADATPTDAVHVEAGTDEPVTLADADGASVAVDEAVSLDETEDTDDALDADDAPLDHLNATMDVPPSSASEPDDDPSPPVHPPPPAVPKADPLRPPASEFFGFDLGDSNDDDDSLGAGWADWDAALDPTEVLGTDAALPDAEIPNAELQDDEQQEAELHLDPTPNEEPSDPSSASPTALFSAAPDVAPITELPASSEPDTPLGIVPPAETLGYEAASLLSLGAETDAEPVDAEPANLGDFSDADVRRAVASEAPDTAQSGSADPQPDGAFADLDIGIDAAWEADSWDVPPSDPAPGDVDNAAEEERTSASTGLGDDAIDPLFVGPPIFEVESSADDPFLVDEGRASEDRPDERTDDSEAADGLVPDPLTQSDALPPVSLDDAPASAFSALDADFAADPEPETPSPTWTDPSTPVPATFLDDALDPTASLVSPPLFEEPTGALPAGDLTDEVPDAEASDSEVSDSGASAPEMIAGAGALGLAFLGAAAASRDDDPDIPAEVPSPESPADTHREDALYSDSVLYGDEAVPNPDVPFDAPAQESRAPDALPDEDAWIPDEAMVPLDAIHDAEPVPEEPISSTVDVVEPNPDVAPDSFEGWSTPPEATTPEVLSIDDWQTPDPVEATTRPDQLPLGRFDEMGPSAPPLVGSLPFQDGLPDADPVTMPLTADLFEEAPAPVAATMGGDPPAERTRRSSWPWLLLLLLLLALPVAGYYLWQQLNGSAEAPVALTPAAPELDASSGSDLDPVTGEQGTPIAEAPLSDADAPADPFDDTASEDAAPEAASDAAAADDAAETLLADEPEEEGAPEPSPVASGLRGSGGIDVSQGGYTWVVTTDVNAGPSAQQQVAQYRAQGFRSGIVLGTVDGRTVERVCVGQFATLDAAREVRAQLPAGVSGSSWMLNLNSPTVQR